MSKRDPKLDRLMTSDTFAQLGERRLRALAPFMDDVELPTGSTLMKEGSFPYELMVIVEGGADVVIGDQKVSEVGAGAVLGEMALLEKGRRSATVITNAETKLVVLSGRAFSGLLEKFPEVAAEIRSMAAARAEVNANLSE